MLIRCSHGQESTEDVIRKLPHSQAGTGRHKCAVCAYARGFEDGLCNNPITQGELCEHNSEAPVVTLAQLIDSQAGIERHKCTNCAYARGYRDGINQAGLAQIARESLETELDTHGIFEINDQPETEGGKRLRTHVVYERSKRNREKAIEIHGTTCAACGFNFDDTYGEGFARHYIEVHHVESVTTVAGRIVDPGVDLVPLCSNCHSMAHREKGRILAVSDIQALIQSAQQKKNP